MSFQPPEVRLLFPAPLVTIRLDGADALNSKLLEEIGRRRETETGVTRSNRSGWHSQSDLFERAEPAHAALASELMEMVKSANARLMPEVDHSVLHVECDGWVNVSPTGAMNAPHDHPGSFWSGCYYIQVPPADDPNDQLPGAIEFLDSRGQLGAGASVDTAFTRGKFTLRPTAGTALLWPSFLKHWVYPNCSAQDRVTAAFNARFRRARYPG